MHLIGAKYEPKSPEIFDVLMYNTSRQITETTIANVAIRKKHTISNDQKDAVNQWITPEVKCGLLNGVKRQHLLSHFKITEGVINLDELINQGLENWEVMCFNEVRGSYKVKLVHRSADRAWSG